MTAPLSSDDTTQTGEHARLLASEWTEVGFVRATRASSDRDPRMPDPRMPHDVSDDDRWIWENPEVIGAIMRGRDQLARGQRVRRSFLELETDD